MNAIRHSLVVLALACAALHGWVHAQVVDSVRMNRDAVLLKRIWSVRGPQAFDEVGRTLGMLGDYDHDGYADFAFRSAEDDRDTRRVFRGGPNGPIEDLRYRNSTSYYFLDNVVGDFWGTGFAAVGARADTLNISGSPNIVRLRVLRTESGELDTTPALEWLPFRPDASRYGGVRFIASDLDRDGFDELIVGTTTVVRPQHNSDTVQLLVYRGGSAFQLDSPVVVLRDNQRLYQNAALFLAASDIDGDGYKDLAFTAIYGYQNTLPICSLKIWFGGPTLLDLDRSPDREIRLPGLWNYVLDDFDGDGKADLATGARFNEFGSSIGVRLHLSSSGKDPRTRAYDDEDADRLFLISGGRPYAIGPINDSTRRYSSLGITGSGFDQMLLIFSGGSNGPDSDADAFYSTYRDHMFEGRAVGSGGPAGDLNGDGFADLVFANPSWTDLRYGIVVALAGGDYIPGEPITSARSEPRHRTASEVTIRPNPVHSVARLHFGTAYVPSQPVELTLIDVRGNRAMSTSISPTEDSSLDCSHLMPGVYIALFRSLQGEIVGATTLVKE